MLHEQEIIDALMRAAELGELPGLFDFLSLQSRGALPEASQGCGERIRREEVIARSIARLPLYQGLKTIKIPVSDLSPRQTAERIISLEAPDDGEA